MIIDWVEGLITGVILSTDTGIFLCVESCCSNGAFWDKDGCYKYINNEKSFFLKEHQAEKLKSISHKITGKGNGDEKWFEKEENFIQVFKKNIKIPK